MRVSGALLAFGVVATVAIQVATTREAHAQSNPIQYGLVYGDRLSSGQIQPHCTSPSTQNCILNDSATYQVISLNTTPLSARIGYVSSVASSDEYGPDVPWCTLQIWCHDGGGAQHVITDHQDGADCALANIMYQNPPGTSCDIADQIFLAVGINRGGWQWWW